MWTKSIEYVLAAIGLSGHLALLIVLIRRKPTARQPLFTVLIGFYLLRSAIFLLAHLITVGLWLYWLMIGIDPVLQFALFAAIVHAWRPFAFASTAARTFAVFGLLIAACISGIAAWYIGPSSHFSLFNLSIKAGIFVSVLWIEAGIGLLVTKEHSAKQLPKVTQIIVWGFAVYSVANVATEIGHMHYAAVRHAAPYFGLSYMRITVYLLCLLLWLTTFVEETKRAGTAVLHPG